MIQANFQLPSYDFFLGAVTVLTIILVPKVFGLLQYPSVESIQIEANKKCNQNLGDPKRLSVWGFEGKGEYVSYEDGIPDHSSYTGLVECFLRLHKIDYDKLTTNMLTESPRKQAPVANIFGYVTDESAKIIDTVKKHYKLQDPVLTAQQEALAHFVYTITTKSLSKVLLHMIFLTEVGRETFWDVMKWGIPGPLRPLIKAMIFRDQALKLAHQGIATTPEEDVLENGRKDLQFLATILGKQNYILGTKKATDADVYVYVFVGHIFYSHLYCDQPWSRKMKADFPSLEAYTSRMKSEIFPELS